MSINYQFGDVDAHGASIRAQAASLEAEHQAIVRDVIAAGDFWGGAGSVACQEFITQLGRNFQVIYEQANAHGSEGADRRQQHGQHRQLRRGQLGLTRNFRRRSTPHVGVFAPLRRAAAPQPSWSWSALSQTSSGSRSERSKRHRSRSTCNDTERVVNHPNPDLLSPVALAPRAAADAPRPAAVAGNCRRRGVDRLGNRTCACARVG